MKLLPPKSGSGRQVEMWTQRVSAEITNIYFSMARAYLAANQSITHNVATKVSGYTENWDIGGNFASDKFTAPVKGYYHVTGSIFLYDAESKLNYCAAFIYLNGVVQTRLGSWQGTDMTYIAINGSDVVYMTAGQYLELYGYVLLSTAGVDTALMAADSANTFLSVHLIST